LDQVRGPLDHIAIRHRDLEQWRTRRARRTWNERTLALEQTRKPEEILNIDQGKRTRS